jgi:transketolase
MQNDLQKLAQLVRYNILTSTTEAGSGHPTSSMSATELMTSLFFGGYFHQDLQDPFSLKNDHFILSKGHASPLLYSLYQAAGAISRDELMTLRKQGSNLEGHPTPRFKYAQITTGSLGQGLSVGLGMALGIRIQMQNNNVKSEYVPKVFVLMGDSEMAEGQNWEAMELAAYHKASNLVGFIDVNRLGQRGETMLQWDIETFAKRASSFGWNAVVIDDGHDLAKIKAAYDANIPNATKPTMFIAKTVKGKGVSFLENVNGWHGKPVPKDKLADALKEIGEADLSLVGKIAPAVELMGGQSDKPLQTEIISPYTVEQIYSSREAHGDALVALGRAGKNIVVLDAEIANSTFSEKFQKEFPDRFIEGFIAEQNMVSMALGLAKVELTPFTSTFAAFYTRAFDQIRMVQYAEAPFRAVGTHAGVYIGQDGASQMGLEDIAMMRTITGSHVFAAADATSAFKLVHEMKDEKGVVYLRTLREKTPVIYDAAETFPVGGSKIHQKSAENSAVVFAHGVTVLEALKAQEALKNEGINICVVDVYSIKPLDEKTVAELTQKYKHVVVAEDHYPAGGLGDVVAACLTTHSIAAESFTHLCVKEIPHSASPEELLHTHGIDAEAIAEAVKTHA